MDSYRFIQPEKPNAVVAGFNRFDNISKFLTLIEVFVAVALISWLSTQLPKVFKLSGEYLCAYSSYVMNQHVVFLLGNVIVVVCYVLSGHTDVGNETAGPEISEDNNNNNKYRSEYHCKTSEVASDIELVKPPSPPPPVEQLPEKMKQTTPMKAEMVIKQATKQIEKFQRTQSVKLRREISMKPRGELRRSVSERRGSDGCSTASTVEKLSSEEFRLAVEAFISKQQKILKQQTMVEESFIFDF